MTQINHPIHQLNFWRNHNTFTNDKQHKIDALLSKHKFRYRKTHKWGKLHFIIIIKNWP